MLFLLFDHTSYCHERYNYHERKGGGGYDPIKLFNVFMGTGFLSVHVIFSDKMEEKINTTQ